MNDLILTERTISSFPLSIGTAISFESIFTPQLKPYDPEREIPNKVDLSNYGQILINISTLFRNLVGSISKETFLQVSPEVLFNTLDQEIQIIDSLFSNEGPQDFDVIYYIDNYNSLFSRDGKHSIKIRHNNSTEGQQLYNTKLIKTFQLFKRSSYQRHIEYTDSVLPRVSRKPALCLTNIPWDLTSYNNFTLLSLLESHTGKLKNRSLWWTKLFPMTSPLNNIPFNKATLLAFGDHNTIHPWPRKARETIMQVADTGHWTSMTTPDKVKLDMNIFCKDKFLASEFLSYF